MSGGVGDAQCKLLMEMGRRDFGYELAEACVGSIRRGENYIKLHSGSPISITTQRREH
jgi:hypothetical protein